MSRESSAVSYLDSKQAEIERLMRVGDITDQNRRRRTTKEAGKAYLQVRDLVENEKMSTHAACKLVGVKQSNYSPYASRMGWIKARPGRAPMTISKETLDKCHRMRREGLTWKVIGEKLGRHYKSLSRAYKRQTINQ